MIQGQRKGEDRGISHFIRLDKYHHGKVNGNMWKWSLRCLPWAEDIVSDKVSELQVDEGQRTSIDMSFIPQSVSWAGD